MIETAKKPATYQDLLQVPDHLVAEIIDGELFTGPAAGQLAGACLHEDQRHVPPFDLGDGGPGDWWMTFSFPISADGAASECLPIPMPPFSLS